MDKVYNLANELCEQVEKTMRDTYKVKVVGHFEIKDYLVIMSFATDKKMVRLTYFKEEILKGVSAITVMTLLVEDFGLISAQ